MPNPNVGLKPAMADYICGIYRGGTGGRIFELPVDQDGITVRFFVPTASAVSSAVADVIYCFLYDTQVAVESADPQMRQFGLEGNVTNVMRCMWNMYLTGNKACIPCPGNSLAISDRERMEVQIKYNFTTEAAALSASHARTTCDACATGYFKSGGECVPCPTGGSNVSSWGTGELSSCFDLMQMDNLTVSGTDTTGSYTTTYVADPLLNQAPGVTSNYVTCPYQE
ncbi:hypothetical protein HDR63_02940 [bacterium]|nr:hypothetical protein [bacterium]